jgi:hypothetical protein
MKIFLATTIAFLALALASEAQWLQPTGSTNLTTTTNNVGIGTPATAGLLHVKNNSTDFLTSTASFDIGTNAAPGGWAPGVRILNSSGSDGTDGVAFGARGSGTTVNYAFISFPSTASGILGYNSDKILVLNNAGNVGIGTITPTAGSRLHVANVATSSVEIESTGGGRAQTNYKAGSDFATGINIDGNFGIVPNTDVSGATGLWMNQSGNISIGTTDPQGYKLAVNGSAIATSMTVKLNANWPDFAFKPAYKLPSLTDIKTYIDKNHHLQDVPSTAEVKRNGHNLGEMNIVLLKKVEELTLYLIELNKTTAELTKTATAQQKEIEELKNK